jgi:hypothetical protein
VDRRRFTRPELNFCVNGIALARRAATRQSVSSPVQSRRAASRDTYPCVPTNLKKLKSCFEEQHAISDWH